MQVRAADSAPVQLDLDVIALVDLALRDVLDADVPPPCTNVQPSCEPLSTWDESHPGPRPRRLRRRYVRHEAKSIVL